jgi:hypothetical protein
MRAARRNKANKSAPMQAISINEKEDLRLD